YRREGRKSFFSIALDVCSIWNYFNIFYLRGSLYVANEHYFWCGFVYFNDGSDCGLFPCFIRYTGYSDAGYETCGPENDCCCEIYSYFHLFNSAFGLVHGYSFVFHAFCTRYSFYGFIYCAACSFSIIYNGLDSSYLCFCTESIFRGSAAKYDYLYPNRVCSWYHRWVSADYSNIRVHRYRSGLSV